MFIFPNPRCTSPFFMVWSHSTHTTRASDILARSGRAQPCSGAAGDLALAILHDVQQLIHRGAVAPRTELKAPHIMTAWSSSSHRWLFSENKHVLTPAAACAPMGHGNEEHRRGAVKRWGHPFPVTNHACFMRDAMRQVI